MFVVSFSARHILTSAVHEFPDVSGCHDVIGTKIVSNLAANRHNYGHDQMGKCRDYANLMMTNKK